MLSMCSFQHSLQHTEANKQETQKRLLINYDNDKGKINKKQIHK